MKKFIALILAILLVSAQSVFAQSDEAFGSFDEVHLAETYIDKTINLFGSEKTLEDVLLEGWSNLSDKIDIKSYNVSVSDLASVYRGILHNNPKFYYVSTGLSYSYNRTTNKVNFVVPVYSENNITTINNIWNQIDDATEDIMLYLDETMTDFEKIMAVHDYMVLHYEYDYSYSNYNITIMLTKRGVCMAYALAFKHMMNVLGIDCLYVAASETMDHGWNLVKLDGKWYHIDLTWDDPGTNFGQVSHKYALLSDYEIQHLENPHYGYDSKGMEADSDKYDKTHWHDGIGAIVTIGDKYYYVDGNNLVDDKGNVIFRNLDGGDNGWSIGGGYYFTSGNYAGIAERNGILYFNTDKAIYSYNPKNNQLKQILTYEGVCGIFIDKNTLEYCKYDMNLNYFVEAGRYFLGNIRFGGTFHENGKIVKRIYKENAERMCVYASCDKCIQMEKITTPGLKKITFDNKNCQTLFFWDENMTPLKEKEVYN